VHFIGFSVNLMVTVTVTAKMKLRVLKTFVIQDFLPLKPLKVTAL